MISDNNGLWACLWCTEFYESFWAFRKYINVPIKRDNSLDDEFRPARDHFRDFKNDVLWSKYDCRDEDGFTPCHILNRFGLDHAAGSLEES